MKNTKGLYALLALLFAVFLIYGVFYNAFGANSENCMGYFGITETRLGLIITAQSIAGVMTTLFLAFFGERVNKLKGVALGLALLTVSCVMIAALPRLFGQGEGYGAAVALFAIAGVGFMTIDLLMNGLIAELFPDRKSVFLPYLHALYGTGAMLAPVFVAAVIQENDPASFATPYAVLGALGVITLAGLIAAGARTGDILSADDARRMCERAREDPAEVFKSAKAWLMLLGGTLYLCFQISMTTWLPGFLTQSQGYDHRLASAALSVYFLGALVMRFVSPLIYRRASAGRFYAASLIISTAIFGAGFPLAKNTAAFLALMAVGGFAQGASIPSLVILCCDAFPGRTASASSLVMLSVSIGGFISPMAMGFLIERMGYLPPMLMTAACLALSAGVIFMATRRDGVAV